MACGWHSLCFVGYWYAVIGYYENASISTLSFYQRRILYYHKVQLTGDSPSTANHFCSLYRVFVTALVSLRWASFIVKYMPQYIVCCCAFGGLCILSLFEKELGVSNLVVCFSTQYIKSIFLVPNICLCQSLPGTTGLMVPNFLYQQFNTTSKGFWNE